jgi:hypothetical protein
MKKIITEADILLHNPCPGWTEERIKDKIGTGKTLLQIARMWSVSEIYRIWCVTRFLTDKQNRIFAIWCARQCQTDIHEITEYIDVIEKYYDDNATQEELNIARRIVENTIDWRIESAQDWEASNAAGWASYRGAEKAAYIAANRAAYWAADRARMRKKQLRKMKEIIVSEREED